MGRCRVLVLDSREPKTAMFSGNLGKEGMTGLKGDMRRGFIGCW